MKPKDIAALKLIALTLAEAIDHIEKITTRTDSEEQDLTTRVVLNIARTVCAARTDDERYDAITTLRLALRDLDNAHGE